MPEDEELPTDGEPTDGEKAEDEGDGLDIPPTHDPYSFKIWTIVSAQQSQNGLRHNDHLRYRQYCSRRLRRLHNVLRFKHGRGRFKQVPYPADFKDVRFLEIPLTQAERAWSYGVQLKADNANAATTNPQWRLHSIKRFAKAVKYGRWLERVCKRHTDQRTQLEAEAYAAFLEGTWLLEKEQWQEALTKLTRCKKVCEHLGLASAQAESGIFKGKLQELAPNIRECRYNLGMTNEEGEDEPVKLAISGKSQELSELSYRGNRLAIPSDKIKGKLMTCLKLVSNIKVGGKDQESAEVIEKYGEIGAEFGDALKDIHSDMIAAGAGGETAEWRMLEAFARELSVCMNVERNLVLLRNHLTKLDGLQEVSSAEARRIYRPDEGMRFCDLLKEDIDGLKTLPETSESISRTLSAYVALVMNYRCFFLALCHCSLGKCLEAAALLDMLHSRVEDVDLSEVLPEPLARCHAIFGRVQGGIMSRVTQWRCRVLTKMCQEARKSSSKGEDGPQGGKQAPVVQDLAAFPPRFRDVPCKPLLFDLAFPLIEAPDLDALLPKRQGGEKKGAMHHLGRAASGIGSRLGGLFGGRK